jgi:hypothetical protein
MCDLYFAVSFVWGWGDVECETVRDIWICQTVYSAGCRLTAISMSHVNFGSDCTSVSTDLD